MELKKVTIGGCELYHADCLDVLPTLQQVSHVITDPPYEAESHTKARRLLGRSERNGSRVIGTFPIEFEQISEDLRHDVGREIERVCAGWSLLFCQIEGVQKWREALPGVKYMRTCIWVKPDGAPQFTGDRPGMGYETIVTFWHGKGRSRWNGGGRHGAHAAFVPYFA